MAEKVAAKVEKTRADVRAEERAKVKTTTIDYARRGSSIATQLYRYTGPDGEHEHEGKPLLRGNTALLTDKQAGSLGDLFEPVEPVPAKANPPAQTGGVEA